MIIREALLGVNRLFLDTAPVIYWVEWTGNAVFYLASKDSTASNG